MSTRQYIAAMNLVVEKNPDVKVINVRQVKKTAHRIRKSQIASQGFWTEFQTVAFPGQPRRRNLQDKHLYLIYIFIRGISAQTEPFITRCRLYLFNSTVIYIHQSFIQANFSPKLYLMDVIDVNCICSSI